MTYLTKPTAGKLEARRGVLTACELALDALGWNGFANDAKSCNPQDTERFNQVVRATRNVLMRENTAQAQAMLTKLNASIPFC